MTVGRARPKAARRDRKVRTNLRPPASSFLGRRAELDALAALFDDARLVTLVGPGGIGKTRLAQRHAELRLATLGRADRGGVWFVDLAQVETAVEALAGTAAVLGVDLAGHAGERAMSDAIGLALARLGPALVVVDNVEQLGAAAARLVSRWLDLAPSTRLLVTSRAVLGLPAEHVVTLGPLEPEDARALFVERARAVRGGDRLEADASHIHDIVESIDRMPLAIELAASRMRVLSTGELRQRLERPSEILTGGVTNARHASVRRAVLDSLALLPAPVRRFFALASVLRNGFTLEAAESTLGPIAVRPGEVLDSLDALVRTSLLRVEHGDGEPTRYSFFETIREVARELAASDPDVDAVRAAHARHYAALAVRLSPEGLGSLDREVDNLLAAAATSSLRARARGDGACARDAVAIALAVEPVLSRRGLSALRERLFTEALELIALAPDDARSRHAEVHLGRGLSRRELGDIRGAEQDYEAALALCGGPEDLGLRAITLVRLAGIWDVRGDTARARRSLDESIALLRTMPDDVLRTEREAEALLRLGHAHRREGSLDAAHAAISSAAARHRSLGRSEGLAAALYELGVVEMFRARADAAFGHFDEGLAIARRAGARVMEGACLTARGCLLQDLGRLGEALAHHAEAASIFRERGSRYREASALYYLATTYLEREEPAEALAVLEQARSRIEGVGAPRYDALMRSACALALAASGRQDEAARELEHAARALASVPHEPALVAALELHRSTVSLRAGRGTDGNTSLEAARRLVLASPSDDARFALRELERTLGRATVRPHEALCVWGAGEAFACPGGERVALPAGSPLRRILEHLVRQREVAPGEPVSIEAIIEAGWPGEKIGSDAALNRAYVALATLRKRGLRDALLSSGGGYSLSRGVMVRRMGER